MASLLVRRPTEAAVEPLQPTRRLCRSEEMSSRSLLALGFHAVASAPPPLCSSSIEASVHTQRGARGVAFCGCPPLSHPREGTNARGHRDARRVREAGLRESGLRVRPAGIVPVGRKRGFGIAAIGVACLVRCWRWIRDGPVRGVSRVSVGSPPPRSVDKPSGTSLALVVA